MASGRFAPLLWFIGIALFFVATHFWLMSSDLWFVYDDFSWLHRAEFGHGLQSFTFWPTQAYNDRPVGAVYFSILYRLFGMNAQAWHISQLLIHGVNCLLLYLLLSNLAKFEFLKIAFRERILIVGLFACWPKSLLAVQWPAAIFDVLATTFVLSSLLFFARATCSNSISRLVFLLLSLSTFYLGLRTKEAAIVTIAGVAALVFVLVRLKKRNLKEYILMFIPFLVLSLAFIGTIFFYIWNGEKGLVDSTSPYAVDFSFYRVISNCFKYLIHCCPV